MASPINVHSVAKPFQEKLIYEAVEFFKEKFVKVLCIVWLCEIMFFVITSWHYLKRLGNTASLVWALALLEEGCHWLWVLRFLEHKPGPGPFVLSAASSFRSRIVSCLSRTASTACCHPSCHGDNGVNLWTVSRPIKSFSFWELLWLSCLFVAVKHWLRHTVHRNSFHQYLSSWIKLIPEINFENTMQKEIRQGKIDS